MQLLRATSESLQFRTLCSYLDLTAIQPDFDRSLVLQDARDESLPVALAAYSAGAAVLLVTDGPEWLRKSAQAGYFDFTVTRLSEALRILKNEIRKGSSAIIALLDAERSAFMEMADRGVQPDFFCNKNAEDDAMLHVFKRRGARELCIGASAADGILVHHAADWRERRNGDTKMLSRFEDSGKSSPSVAGRWQAAAASLFPHELDRYYAAQWIDTSGEADDDPCSVR